VGQFLNDLRLNIPRPELHAHRQSSTFFHIIHIIQHIQKKMMRKQRIGKLRTLDLHTQFDAAIETRVKSGNLELQIFPPLQEGFPEFQAVKINLAENPQSASIVDQISLQLRDVEGVTQCFAVVQIAGKHLPIQQDERVGEIQILVLNFDLSGKLIGEVQYRAGFHNSYDVPSGHLAAIEYAVQKMLFEKLGSTAAVKVSQEIEPINADMLTHHFTCSVSAPGINFSHRAEVADLRKSGLFAAKEKFFKNGIAWTYQGKAVLIIQESATDFYQVIATDENGAAQRIGRTETKQAAFTAINTHFSTK